MSSVAPSHASFKSGMATTFSGRLIPGKYFTFSCFVLIISVSFSEVPSSCSIISSKTHMLTWFSQWGRILQFRPTRVAIADPQLPLPIIQTLSCCSALFCGLESIIGFIASNDFLESSLVCELIGVLECDGDVKSTGRRFEDVEGLVDSALKARRRLIRINKRQNVRFNEII